MKKLITIVLISSCFLAAPNIGYTVQGALYAPGELLVKYKSPVRAAASYYYRTLWGISSIRTFKKIGIQHVKLPEDLAVQEALEIYRNDPDVEYAEPNYYYHTTTIPNDSYFGQLWGMHNTGQSVDGTSGTADADIDAPEAWDITTGSSNVVVAVIDSGVDYSHPDLSANIWTNTGEIADNGTDDDGNGYIDDVRGWDFVDGDNDPIDSNDHGTHVAGTIAAVGNNATGVAGVSWTAKIMVLRFLNAFGSGTTANAIMAIEYANTKGAHVINNSWGGGGFSQALKDAIDASSAVVVCAAGNDGNNNDTSPHYPSSYTSSNIIAVAATDQDDNLAAFSNYGATSVDVAAPGINTYSTKPARQTVWIDNFDDDNGNISDWETTGGTNNTWGTTNSLSDSGSYSLTDSPAANYLNSTDSWAIAPVRDLSSHRGAKLEFQLRGVSEPNYDFLYVQASTNGLSWTNQNILIGNTTYTRISGTSSDNWLSSTVDLGAYDGNSTVHIRFRFTSDLDTVYDGWYIDDIAVTAASSSYGGTEYQPKDGTSMATPHVSGVAALIKSQSPSLTNTEIKAQIENTVDPKASLSNKVAAGGRVNAYNALTPPEAPSSLLATATSTSQINLVWTDNSSNESGFEVERKTGAGGTYSQIDIVSKDVGSYSDTSLNASTVYYYRGRAYNSVGNSSYSNEANATTATSNSGGGGGGGGCFIATAAYGSSMDSHVEILREFRDNFLLNNSMGKAFVQLYYTYSPPIANFIAKHANLRAMVRMSLLPVIGMSWVALKIDPVYSLALMLLVCSVLIGFVGFRRKFKK